nr:hypothetical protein [uncultured bacterium]AQQ74870.1 hypothetical protein [uncultured bacterium]
MNSTIAMLGHSTTHAETDIAFVAPSPDLGDQLLALGMLRLSGNEQLVLMPSQRFRLSVFLPDELPRPQQLDTSITGIHTRFVPCTFDGNGRLFVALLSARGVIRAFGLPLTDSANRRIAVERLCSEAGLLTARMRAAPSSLGAATALKNWLETRLRAHSPPTDSARRVILTASLLGDPDLDVSIAQLAAHFGMPRRVLARDFREWLGVAPAIYRRLAMRERVRQGSAADCSPLSAALQCRLVDRTRTTQPSHWRPTGDKPSLLRRLLGGRVSFLRDA